MKKAICLSDYQIDDNRFNSVINKLVRDGKNMIIVSLSEGKLISLRKKEKFPKDVIQHTNQMYIFRENL